ncbi:MAG: hypothetical protein V3U17_00445 [Thermoplasmata archaeon]
MEAATPAAAPPVPTPEEFARQKQIDRTKTGLLLLFIGVLLSWVPYVGFVGGIIFLVGAILVILGRKAFGPAHSRNVLIALALFVAGIVGLVAVLVLLVNAIITTVVPTTPEEVLALITTYIPALLVVGGISGLSYPLLAHAVSSRTGQILLWVGYAATLGILAVTYITLIGIFEAAAAIPTDPFGFLTAFLTAFITIFLLFVVSSVLYAVGYYLAYSRVHRGEIPA